jgi:hypothetical protein
MTAGVMRTAEPLRINSPAAQIQIEGEADLKNETQNLQVLVRPQVGSVAAIGAATLVNPLAGAARWLPVQSCRIRSTVCSATAIMSPAAGATRRSKRSANPSRSAARGGRTEEEAGSEQAELPHGGIQMVSGPRVADNLAAAGRLIADAVAQGAQLVRLPEYFPIIGAADADRVRAREDFGAGRSRTGWRDRAAPRHLDFCRFHPVDRSARQDAQFQPGLQPGRRMRRALRQVHLFGFKKGDEATTRPLSSSRAINWPPSIPRLAGSPCRSATTCAFPSCIGRWRRSI